MRLLFITQKIHQNDDDLAFTILWVKEFIKQGFTVEVICLEKGDFDDSFPVYSLGKERGTSKPYQLLTFLKLVFTLSYDRVFVHMNPEYFTLAGWWWFLRGIPTYLWYTHYTMTVHLLVTGIIVKRMFAATPQSLPQYEGNKKKVVVGHGIDISFWKHSDTAAVNPHSIISVHRLSRSKRLDIVLRTLALLPDGYTLTVYGRPINPGYFEELKKLVKKLNIQSRVIFKGPVPMSELQLVYPQHHFMFNMASETIDKTMLEGMLYGMYPVTTSGNAQAIGLSVFPEDEDPETLARFIQSKKWEEIEPQTLRKIVETKHSLPALIQKMSTYIKEGK